MLGLVIAIFVVSWVFRSTLGQAFVLALGVLMLVLLAGTGSLFGLTSAVCLISVLISGLRLARKFRS